jgi:hypothetical protein
MEAIILVQEETGARIKAYRFVGSVYDLFMDIKKLIDSHPNRLAWGYIVVVNPELWKKFMLKILKLDALYKIYSIIQEEIRNAQILVLLVSIQVMQGLYLLSAQFSGRLNLIRQHIRLLRSTGMKEKDEKWFSYVVNDLVICLNEKLRVGYRFSKVYQTSVYFAYNIITEIPREELEKFDNLEDFAYYIVKTIVENEDEIKKREAEGMSAEEFCRRRSEWKQ